MEINTVLEKMVELKIQIDDILRSSTYDEHADLSGLHVDREDSDQLLLCGSWLMQGAALSIYHARLRKSVPYIRTKMGNM